jgi:hypothetical protein
MPRGSNPEGALREDTAADDRDAECRHGTAMPSRRSVTPAPTALRASSAP